MVEHRIQAVEALLIVGNRQFHVRIVENAFGLRRGIGVVNRHGHRTDCSEGEIKQTPFDARGGEDRHGIALLDAECNQTLGDGTNAVIELPGSELAPRAVGLLVLGERGVLAGTCNAVGEQRVDGLVIAHGERRTRRRVFGEHMPYFLVLANNKQSA